MTLDEEVVHIAFSLFERAKVIDPVSATYYLLSAKEGHEEGPFYEHEEALFLLGKIGAIENSEDSYIQCFGPDKLNWRMVKSFTVKATKKQLLDSIVDYLDSKITDSLSDHDQRQKLVTLIHDKRVLHNNRQIHLEEPFFDQNELSDIILGKTIKELSDQKFINVKNIDMQDKAIIFTIEPTDDIEDEYNKLGRYAEKNWIGPKIYRLETNSGEFYWDKIHGYLAKNDQLYRILRLLLLTSGYSITFDNISQELYDKPFVDNANKTNYEQIRNKVKNLNDTLKGGSKRKDKVKKGTKNLSREQLMPGFIKVKDETVSLVP